jgi:hypothetical protein
MTVGRNPRDLGVLVAGAAVYGADGEKIGTIADIGHNYVLVEDGLLNITRRYLPTHLVARADDERVDLSVTKRQAEAMARADLPADESDAWYGVTTGDAATDAAILERTEAPDTTETRGG